MRALALAAGLLAAAPAGAETWDCVARQTVYASDVFSRFSNPIQERMQFVVAPDGGSATVLDPLIRAAYGGPIAAKVTENTDVKLVVTWSMPVQGYALAQATMSFRAAFQKAPNRLIVTATPLGVTERFFARGGCVRTAG
jgi:hypothetical protein